MMEPSEQPNGRTQFGVFEVDPRSGEVRKSGMRVKMQDQPFKVLLALLERPGEVVSRETLRERIWPNESFGDFDHAVNVAVAKLRTALNDSADSPRYIETLHRRGYRFIFPVGSMGGHGTEVGVAPSAAPTGIEANGSSNNGKAIEIQGPSGWSGRRLWATGLVLAVIAAAVISWVRYREPVAAVPPTGDMQISRVTNRGNVGYVSISPDGRYLVYALRDSSGVGLVTREVGTRTDVQILPSNPGDVRGITFSPDGRYIFYAKTRSEGHPTADLYTIPVLGGAPRPLLKDVDAAISFSPDGREFMFIRKDLERNVVEVRIANADGSGERLVTAIDRAGDAHPHGGSWSPDGRTLVVGVTPWGGMPGAELDAISLADGSRRVLISTPTAIGRPIWLPGGREIAVVLANDGGRGQVWTVSYPQGNLRRITQDLEDYDNIDFTSDGKTLAANAWTATGNIYALPKGDFSRARQLTFGREYLDDIIVGPKGRLLVHETGSPDGEVWSMSADGSQRVLFSTIRSSVASARCGSFVLLHGENGRLIRTDENGLNPFELVHADAISPTCPADGRFAYYADKISRPQRILRISVEGGAPVEIAKIPGEGLIGAVAVSPDGKLLAFPFHESGPKPLQRLAVISAEGGLPVKSFVGISGYLRWTPDGRGIDYYAIQDGIRQIVEQPLAGGAPHPLTRFTSEKIHDFEWSVDGKQLYVSHGEISSDAVLITNVR